MNNANRGGVIVLLLPHYLLNDASSCEMSVECRQLSKTSQMSFSKHHSQFCRHVVFDPVSVFIRVIIYP
jgi:hypothetical protein